MGALLRNISAFLGAPFRTSSVWVTASLQCQIWWEPITTSWMHLFHLSACGVYDVCVDLRTCPLWSTWFKAQPCQSIYQTLTVLQHVHYADVCHQSCNDPLPHTYTRTLWLENYRNETKELNSVLFSPVTSFFFFYIFISSQRWSFLSVVQRWNHYHAEFSTGQRRLFHSADSCNLTFFFF